MADQTATSLGSFDNNFTDSVGAVMFGIYNWVAVIILVNMLVAMMSRSFDEIAVMY